MSLDHHHAGRGAPHARRATLAALAVALTFGGLACASDSEPERADTESVDTTNGEAGGTDDTGGSDGDVTGTDDESGDDDGGGSAGASGEGPVLGTARAQLPADPGTTTPVPLRADVTRLERNGELVELSITLTNESPESAGDDLTFDAYDSFTDGGSYDVSGVGLVDPEGQKVYLAAFDSEGVCRCTGDLASHPVPPAGSMVLSATIGGVPDDLEVVDVALPAFPSIVGLTIQ